MFFSRYKGFKLESGFVTLGGEAEDDSADGTADVDTEGGTTDVGGNVGAGGSATFSWGC